MKRKNRETKKYRDLSSNFKIALVILLFFITAFHLLLILYFPSVKVISDKVLLSIALFIISYRWTVATMCGLNGLRN